MLHESREVEISEDIFSTTFDRFGDFGCLFRVMRNLSHFAHEDVVVARIRHRPVKAWEYLGGIAGYKPGEIFGEDFHAVFID